MDQYSVYYPFQERPNKGTPVIVKRPGLLDRRAVIHNSWPVEGGYWADIQFPDTLATMYLDSTYILQTLKA